MRYREHRRDNPLKPALGSFALEGFFLPKHYEWKICFECIIAEAPPPILGLARPRLDVSSI